MKAYILYDSVYGNTQKIAEAIGKGIGNTSTVVKFDKLDPKELETADLIVIGSPTHGGRYTEGIQQVFTQISPKLFQTKPFAAFDTGSVSKGESTFVQLIIKTVGYAAPRIANEIKKQGGKLLMQPESFMVKGKEGPLTEGELERAQTWGQTLAQGLK